MEEKTKFIKEIKKYNSKINLAEIWDYEKETEMYKNQLLSDGFDEGFDEGIGSVIMTMLKADYPFEEISNITGKSIDYIREISLKN